MPKKEALLISRELVKLERNLGGVRNLTSLPSAVFIIDLNVEHTAVKEASRLGIPVIALVDSNCDPDDVDIIIPGNDDAVRSAQLMAGVIADACAAGKALVGKDEIAKMTADAEKAPKGEPDAVDAATPGTDS